MSHNNSSEGTILPEPNPGIIRRLYDWVLHWADTPYGVPALFILAFVESSFFPIPPDVLLIGLALGKPKRAFWFATICSIGSVLGGLLGYWIGWAVYDTVGRPLVEFYHLQDKIEYVMNQYRQNAFLAIIIAGFTPIPYKVFTIAAGMAEISIATLVGASALGRSGRFFLVALVIYFMGEKAQHFIDKYFDRLTIAFVILLVGGFLIMRWFK